jgi:hypothetical protein
MYSEVVEADMAFTRWVLDVRQKHAPFRKFMNAVTSHHPLKDVGLVIWVVGIIAVRDLGYPFLWTLVAHIVVCSVLQAMLSIRRPADVDPSLRPFVLTDLNEYAGFPSLESVLSVVVFGTVIIRTNNELTQFACISAILFIGFSRVYSCRWDTTRPSAPPPTLTPRPPRAALPLAAPATAALQPLRAPGGGQLALRGPGPGGGRTGARGVGR